jgi:hypothetical protein
VFIALRSSYVAAAVSSRLVIGAFCTLVLGCDRFESSSQPGIELPRFERTFDQSDQSPALLEYGTGSHQGWTGVTVRRDGTVWMHGKDVSQRCLVLPSYAEHSECRLRNSRLVARLGTELRDRLIAASDAADPADQRTAERRGFDGGFGTLELPRTSARQRVVVGGCSASRNAQLVSKQGEEIVRLFRVLRNAVPAIPEPADCPPEDVAGQLFPGIVGWWKI